MKVSESRILVAQIDRTLQTAQNMKKYGESDSSICYYLINKIQQLRIDVSFVTEGGEKNGRDKK